MLSLIPTPLPRRIRRADRPGFRNEIRNVPAMIPTAVAAPVSLVRPGTARYFEPPRYVAPSDSTWHVLAFGPDGSVTVADVGTFGHCADVAAARGRHPSSVGTRYATVPAERSAERLANLARVGAML